MAPSQSLKNKAIVGISALGIKRILLQFIFTFTNIFLARILFPADFGTFAIVGSIIMFFSVFSDVGLTPALIQKKGRLTVEDIRTAFTLQLILGLLLLIILNLFSGVIIKFFNLGTTGVGLLRLNSLIFLINPFSLIPGAILERNLSYKKIVIFDLARILVSSITSVSFALSGFGVWSLLFGLLVAHVFGVFLFALFARWPMGIQISRKNLVSLANFGLPFQSNLVLGLFYGPLIMLYLGKKVGQENLGYFQFAASLSAFSLAVSDIINRIVFPLGSRLQHNKEFIRSIVERAISIVSATSLPLVSMMLVAVPQIVHFVYTDKWLPAVPALYFGIVQMGIIAYTGILGQILLALGHSKIMRNMGFVWAILTWIFGPILINRFNFVGMSMLGLLVSASGFWLLFKLKREVNFSFWNNFYPYFASSILSVGFLIITKNFFGGSFLSFLLLLLSAGAVYSALIFYLRRDFVISNLKLAVEIFGGKFLSRNSK